jgi:predicted outer membrane protein
MKNQNKGIGDVQDLVERLLIHPKTPEWLKDVVWEVVNDRSNMDAYDENYVRVMVDSVNWDVEEDES